MLCQVRVYNSIHVHDDSASKFPTKVKRGNTHLSWCDCSLWPKQTLQQTTYVYLTLLNAILLLAIFSNQSLIMGIVEFFYVIIATTDKTIQKQIVCCCHQYISSIHVCTAKSRKDTCLKSKECREAQRKYNIKFLAVLLTM